MMRAAVAAVVTALALGVGPAAAVARYRPGGPYLDYAGNARWQAGPTVRFRGGLPQAHESSGWVDNPVTIEQWALQADAQHRPGEVRRAARWLVKNQRPNGEWTYDFPFSVPGTPAVLMSPWGSALAQGQALSLLTRAYRHTGDVRYLAAANRALATLRVRVPHGGLVRFFRGHQFYEEYPTTPRPSYVLNGFMFTLIGLYDMAHTDPASMAGRMYRRGIRTLRIALPFYDLPSGLSVYDLGYLTFGSPKFPAGPYQRIHVELLTALHTIDRGAVVAYYLRRWRRAYDAGDAGSQARLPGPFDGLDPGFG